MSNEKLIDQLLNSVDVLVTTNLRFVVIDALAQADKEIESLRKDAARWKYIESHWTFADIKNNKDGSFKNMTIKFDADKPTNEIGAEKLRKGFDSVIAAMPEGE